MLHLLPPPPRYVNAHDPNDEHHIVRLYDFFYYKVGGEGRGVHMQMPTCA